jgi:TrmH family RNA methyltransferase
MALSKNQLKLITSLKQKKYRQKHNLFVVEGVKTVQEFLNSNFVLNQLFFTEDMGYSSFLNSTEITEQELQKISSLKTPNKVLALFELPTEKTLKTNGLILVLDAINDPGNLGTIIRLCDWFGIDQLVCSNDTVDCFNSKVVQASMGSLARASIYYTNIIEYLSTSKLPKFAADMNGENVYTTSLPKNAILVLGNEANGIRKEVYSEITNVISIPRFGAMQETESLNVATATAIFLSEFKRG